jgi:hypothetical protein
MIGSTPAILGTHEVARFKGQSSPALFRTSLGDSDMDGPLLGELMVRWQRRYESPEPAWQDIALMRSLNMAYQASLLPAGTDTTFYDVGRIVSLWVSAFEILVHPGGNGQANRDKVFELIESTPWEIPASGRRTHDTGGKTKVKRTLASGAVRIPKRLPARQPCRAQQSRPHDTTAVNCRVWRASLPTRADGIPAANISCADALV